MFFINLGTDFITNRLTDVLINIRHKAGISFICCFLTIFISSGALFFSICQFRLTPKAICSYRCLIKD